MITCSLRGARRGIRHDSVQGQRVQASKLVSDVDGLDAAAQSGLSQHLQSPRLRRSQRKKGTCLQFSFSMYRSWNIATLHLLLVVFLITKTYGRCCEVDNILRISMMHTLKSVCTCQLAAMMMTK